jgi:hypothetical protein
MFSKTHIVVATLLVASPAVAQQFTGGELGVEYNSLLDADDVDGTSYFAGAELSFNREFAVAVDVSNIEAVGENGNDVTLHGIYHLNDNASMGLFYSRDNDDAAKIGIEGGIEFMGGDISAYVGQLQIDDETALVVGFSSDTPIYQNISVFTDFDIVGDDSLAISTNEIGVEYAFDQGPEVYAQFGRFNVEAGGVSADQDYVGIGARIKFGAARGTTFEAR